MFTSWAGIGVEKLSSMVADSYMGLCISLLFEVELFVIGMDLKYDLSSINPVVCRLNVVLPVYCPACRNVSEVDFTA